MPYGPAPYTPPVPYRAPRAVPALPSFTNPYGQAQIVQQGNPLLQPGQVGSFTPGTVGPSSPFPRSNRPTRASVGLRDLAAGSRTGGSPRTSPTFGSRAPGAAPRAALPPAQYSGNPLGNARFVAGQTLRSAAPSAATMFGGKLPTPSALAGAGNLAKMGRGALRFGAPLAWGVGTDLASNALAQSGAPGTGVASQAVGAAGLPGQAALLAGRNPFNPVTAGVALGEVVSQTDPARGAMNWLRDKVGFDSPLAEGAGVGSIPGNIWDAVKPKTPGPGIGDAALAQDREAQRTTILTGAAQAAGVDPEMVFADYEQAFSEARYLLDAQNLDLPAEQRLTGDELDGMARQQVTTAIIGSLNERAGQMEQQKQVFAQQQAYQGLLTKAFAPLTERAQAYGQASQQAYTSLAGSLPGHLAPFAQAQADLAVPQMQNIVDSYQMQAMTQPAIESNAALQAAQAQYQQWMEAQAQAALRDQYETQPDAFAQ